MINQHSLYINAGGDTGNRERTFLSTVILYPLMIFNSFSHFCSYPNFLFYNLFIRSNDFLTWRRSATV